MGLIQIAFVFVFVVVIEVDGLRDQREAKEV